MYDLFYMMGFSLVTIILVLVKFGWIVALVYAISGVILFVVMNAVIRKFDGGKPCKKQEIPDITSCPK